MLKGPSIGRSKHRGLGSLGGLEAVSSPENKSLPSSADTWSSQLMVNAFPSGIRVGKAVGSFREGNLLEESLPIVTLGAVGILGSEPMLSSSLSPEEDEDKASGEGFLEAEEAETLLEECLAMQRV